MSLLDAMLLGPHLWENPDWDLGAPRYYGRAVQIRRLANENNVVKLKPNPYADPEIGYGGIAVASNRPLAVHQLLVRGNIVRLSTAERYSNQHPRGLFLDQCGYGLIEHNLMHLESDDAVFNVGGPSLRFFNNRDSHGRLLRSYNTNSRPGALMGRTRELVDEIDDALTLVLLKRRS